MDHNTMSRFSNLSCYRLMAWSRHHSLKFMLGRMVFSKFNGGAASIACAVGHLQSTCSLSSKAAGHSRHRKSP
ncbi:hypothetical protein RchiOBHm_Chr4g0391381 [Rosa chinensis]|uniref:Uncharacterized protein n=1 Tax=Rosa chinensis TaxID=74649 RepID=A0A2P6QQH5_ROSCH|nr:hypothetical protein RchiOBHm_Chr4g0391381 [Rosa chinensis]